MSLLLLGLPLPSSPCALRKYLFTFCTHLAKPQSWMIHLSPCLDSASDHWVQMLGGKSHNEPSLHLFACSLSAGTRQAPFFIELLETARQEVPQSPALPHTHLTVITSSALSFLLLQRPKCLFLWNPSMVSGVHPPTFFDFNLSLSTATIPGALEHVPLSVSLTTMTWSFDPLIQCHCLVATLAFLTFTLKL